MRLFFFLLFSSTLFAKPLLIVTQPRSGTTYLRSTLSKYFGGHIRTDEFPTFRPSPDAFRHLAQKYRYRDIPLVHHFNFTDHTMIEEVARQGCQAVFVARDPRASTVSQAIFGTIYREGLTPQRVHHLTPQEEEKVRLFLSKRFKHFFQRRIKGLKKWKRWSEAYPQTVTICHFQELKKDPNNFFPKLLAPFGYHHGNFRFHTIEPPRLGNAHYRNSKEREWEHLLTEDLITYANRLLTDELLTFYGWER